MPQLRFRALNEEEAEAGYAVGCELAENEEAKSLELYSDALALQGSGDLRAAKLRYKQLLRSPFLASVGPALSAHEAAGGAQQQQVPADSSAAARKLRYLCLKNLADINETQGNANAALKYYVLVCLSSPPCH